MMSGVVSGTQPDLEAVVGDYVAAWSEPEPARRRKWLARAFAADGTYTDPQSQAVSRAELDALIDHFLQANPGAVFTIDGPVDAHHGHLRFWWILQLAGGAQVRGMDYGSLAADGRLATIVGFF